MNVELISTPNAAVSKLSGKAVPKFIQDANALARGKRITSVGYMVSAELEWPIPYIELEDGTLITSGADDEGNGPGVLHFEKDSKHSILCETSSTHTSR